MLTGSKLNFIFCLALLVAQSMYGQTKCFIISGAKKDHNGALKNCKFLNESTQIAGTKCEVLESWNSIDKMLVGVEPGTQILIYQKAHGGPGGFAECNDSVDNGDEILNKLQAYSKRYKIAAILDSCFSGDVMREKLIRDYQEPQNLGNTNLCLITSSHFGRMSKGMNYDMDPALQTVVKNENIEGVFQCSKVNGLISSAAWDLVGIPQYLSNVGDNISQPIAILQKIQELLPLSRGDSFQRANKIIQSCLGGKACDNNFWELSRFLSTKEDVNDLSVEYVKKDRQGPRERQKNQALNSNKSSNVSVDIAKCVEDYDQAFEQFISAMSNSQTIAVKQSLNFFNTYENSPQFKECASIIKDKEALRRFVGSSKVSRMIDKYIEAKERYKKLNVDKSQTKIFGSMFGFEFFPQEIDKETNLPERLYLSPVIVIEEFIRSSLKIENYSNKNDSARRDACRNFKF